ncbi:hypothetical protein, partial [Micromonospora sp. NPDC050200]|uniref:hypothetical protein n=1 Tax=Micromonospora sp. NPDC050200 TaxID=3155664 RepID=UPI0033FD7010
MTPPDPRLLGPLIAQLRLARGWSQQRLADELCAASGAPTVTRHEISGSHACSGNWPDLPVAPSSSSRPSASTVPLV